MAHALATGLAASWDGTITVAEPVAAQRTRFAAPVSTVIDNVLAAEAADVIVLAVKPQLLETVVREIAPAVGARLIVSIAAGVPVRAIAGWLTKSADDLPGPAIVRCMPNTPALIGLGITGAFANEAVTPSQRETASKLMQAAGELIWFDSESALDAVTAVSGSGPAYFFYVIEALADAGARLGLSREDALRLAVATARGAAAMAAEDDPVVLRQRVTSPGGTTERALAILAQESLPETLDDAVRGAFERSQELAKEFGS